MKKICGISVKAALITSALVVLLAVTAAAQTQPAETGGPAKHHSVQDIVNERVADGFAAIGPFELKKASSSELVLNAPEMGDAATVSLKNKRVSVFDQADNGLTISSLSTGKWVIVCQKKGEVVIYLLARGAGKKGSE